ncbi:MAG: VOC family protein [Heyndrickxia sp.]
MYIDIQHVSVVVMDLERAKLFYGNILGFKEIERPNFETNGAWYEVGRTQLHLIVYPKGKAFRGTTTLDQDDGHFAVQVSNMKDFMNRMKEHDVQVLTVGTVDSGHQRVYVSDPDGNLIEFKP